MSDEYLVDRLHGIVGALRPPPPLRLVLNPVAALAELRAWIDDDHQWTENVQWRNWLSLLEDVTAAFDALPHTTASCLRPATANPLAELVEAKAVLQQDGRAAVGAVMRDDLNDAESTLRRALSDPAAVVASWTDLERAVKRSDTEREDAAVALLAALVELQGSSWDVLSRHLRKVLGDDENAILELQAELDGVPRPDPRLPPRAAGRPAGERLLLAERLLSLPLAEADRIVWIAYLEAHVPEFIVEVGPAVTLYEGRWLVSVIEHWDDSAHAHDHVPTEVAAHRDECLRSWDRGSQGDRPFALMRVALGRGPTVRAREEAVATADVLLRLAAFYNRGHTSWRDIGAFAIFNDGRLGSRTVGIEQPDYASYTNLDLAKDRTATILEELAPTVGGHLPVADPRVRIALDLLHWLVEAQRTWEPAKFLLCDRILERVAGWAGESDPDRFARDYLALYWARQELMDEIVEATHDAVYAIDTSGTQPGDPAQRAAFLEAIGEKSLVSHDVGMRSTVNLRQGLLEIDWLQSWQRPGSLPALQLAALERRVGTPVATERTLRDLEAEFGALLRRVRRTRNAVAHGGPIVAATLESVGRFFEEIASDAINEALYAYMTGQDVRARFADRQARHSQALDDLRAGVSPADALFWRDVAEAA